MTIRHEDHAGWIVVCNTCYEMTMLDIDPDSEFLEAVEAVKSLGWRIRDESYSLPKEGPEGVYRKSKQPYWTHTCTDCKKLKPEEHKSETPVLKDERQSRPYLLGKVAAETGQPKSSCTMGSDEGIRKWNLGYDENLK